MTKSVCASRLIVFNGGGATGLLITATAMSGVRSVGGAPSRVSSRKMSKKLEMVGLMVTGPLLLQSGVCPCTAAMFRPLSGKSPLG